MKNPICFGIFIKQKHKQWGVGRERKKGGDMLRLPKHVAHTYNQMNEWKSNEFQFRMGNTREEWFMCWNRPMVKKNCCELPIFSMIKHKKVFCTVYNENQFYLANAKLIEIYMFWHSNTLPVISQTVALKLILISQCNMQKCSQIKLMLQRIERLTSAWWAINVIWVISFAIGH